MDLCLLPTYIQILFFLLFQDPLDEKSEDCTYTEEPLDEARFFFSSEPMNYDAAQQYCNDNGAKLFEPKHNALNKFVMNLAKNHSATRNIRNTGNEYWIGIRNHDQYSSDNSTTCWSRYSPLNKVVGAGDCDNNAMCTSIIIIGFGTVGAGLESFGLWQDQCCSLKMYSACDKQIGESSYIF